MSIKDGWAEAGKGIGRSFKNLGKAVAKSVKAGADLKLDEEESASLKKSWSEVGHSFGHAGASFGKAIIGTAKGVAEKLDDDEKPVDEVVDAEFEEAEEGSPAEEEPKEE